MTQRSPRFSRFAAVLCVGALTLSGCSLSDAGRAAGEAFGSVAAEGVREAERERGTGSRDSTGTPTPSTPDASAPADDDPGSGLAMDTAEGRQLLREASHRARRALSEAGVGVEGIVPFDEYRDEVADELEQVELYAGDPCADNRDLVARAAADARAQTARLYVAERDWLISDPRIIAEDSVAVTSATTPELHDQLVAAEQDYWDVCTGDDDGGVEVRTVDHRTIYVESWPASTGDLYLVVSEARGLDYVSYGVVLSENFPGTEALIEDIGDRLDAILDALEADADWRD
ncbi:MAG: hypothetical protein Q4G34_09280 [Micrococcus sp.]|nr:hypothetical protein [Micrococcus sp.]